MSIDWASFTPWSALVGGAIIGISAALLVLLNGRIAGISSIIGSLLRPAPGDVAWRVAFVAGLIAAPLLYAFVAGPPVVDIVAGYPALIVAGLLVGVGTRYGSGCTSGHGVCGLSRLSPRSLVATLAFMAAGFAMVFVVRHLIVN
ncbi:MAG: YeeE/YedE family protein [Betaproteobacteria bacterium]